MSRIEIDCPNGIGHKTTVKVDGYIVDGAFDLELRIPADGIAELKIRRFVQNERGQPCAEEDSTGELFPIRQCITFTGELTFSSSESGIKPEEMFVIQRKVR